MHLQIFLTCGSWSAVGHIHGHPVWQSRICADLKGKKRVKVPILVSSLGSWRWFQTLGRKPAGDSMHGHEPGGGLPPPPTRPTATHMHIMNPAVGCPYFPPGPQLPSQPSGVTAFRPVPTYTAVWQRHIGVRNLPKVFTPCAQPRIEPTCWSQVRHYHSTMMPPRFERRVHKW